MIMRRNRVNSSLIPPLIWVPMTTMMPSMINLIRWCSAWKKRTSTSCTTSFKSLFWLYLVRVFFICSWWWSVTILLMTLFSTASRIVIPFPISTSSLMIKYPLSLLSDWVESNFLPLHYYSYHQDQFRDIVHGDLFISSDLCKRNCMLLSCHEYC